MPRRIVQAVGGVLAVLIVLAAPSCRGLITVPVGELREETSVVELGTARSAEIVVKMGVGDLRLAGGADSLMQARFTYNVGEWRPQVRYEVRDGRGSLTVEQPSGPDNFPLGDVRYEWDLRLQDGVPMELSIVLGAGTAKLSLGGLSLDRLDLEVGAGEVTLDLSGEWSKDFVAQIQGGVGHLTVRLPRDVGVRVEASGGLGHINAPDLQYDGSAYVNGAYGHSAVTLRLSVEAGVGAIDLQLE